MDPISLGLTAAAAAAAAAAAELRINPGIHNWRCLLFFSANESASYDVRQVKCNVVTKT